MRAGKLDRYLEVERVTETKDADNSTVSTWSHHLYLWGERRGLSMSERLQAGQVNANISARYFTRYIEDLTEEDRIVDTKESKTYQILGIREIGRRAGLEIFVGTI